MARVSISVPDDVVAAAKAAGLNISRLATNALAAELERLEKVEELDRYLREMDDLHGPVSPEDAAAAVCWVDGIVGPDAQARSP